MWSDRCCFRLDGGDAICPVVRAKGRDKADSVSPAVEAAVKAANITPLLSSAANMTIGVSDGDLSGNESNDDGLKHPHNELASGSGSMSKE